MTCPRQPLLARLDAVMSCRLLLLVMPDDAQRAALLRRWAARCPWPVAQARLAGPDNGPAHFLATLRGALTCASGAALDDPSPSLAAALRLAPSQEPQLGPNTAPRPTPAAASDRALVDGLADLLNSLAVVTPDFALLLDNYHLIVAPAIHAGVAQAVDYLPSPVHLIIATRAEPPLPLPRWRVRRQLLTLRLSPVHVLRGSRLIRAPGPARL